MSDVPHHAVAVIGGAVAGAQVADILSRQGVVVVVFDQKLRPFGKIEDGLPRWHSALRQQEYRKITERLSQDGVHFVPLTRVGEHVDFVELTKDWGFSAVILANGAWRDRKLPIEGIEAYEGKGLYYQNPFIIAFNHQEDDNYDGPKFPIEDGAIIVGGGLASIDVVKIHMLETVRRKLEELGQVFDVESIEKMGVNRACEEAGTTFERLGLKGATLVYRRRAQDMALQAIPEDATEQRIQRVRENRVKMLNRTINKYRFNFEPLATPEEVISDNGKLVGAVMRRMKVGDDGRPSKTDETFEMRCSQIVASIGSVPAPIKGIRMKGELFDFQDWNLGRLEGFPTVFSVGNVVTGKGNIVASRRHATKVTEEVSESYLGIGNELSEAEALAPLEARFAEHVNEISGEIMRLPPVSPERLETILRRVKARQAAVGYGGKLKDWLKKHPAPN